MAIKQPAIQTPLQELYAKFDGVGGDARLAWYGQCRASNQTHEEAIQDTYRHYEYWCREYWPLRGIELPAPTA